MAKCNTIFTALYYFLECYWSFCKLIEGAKPTMPNLLWSINPHDWSIILGGWIKTPSEVWNHPQGTPKFTQLDYIN